MNQAPDAATGADPLAQTQQQLRLLATEALHLSLSDLAPADYYPQLLQRALHALAAPAGVVWVRTPQGHFQQQCQLNPAGGSRERSPAARERHANLLRQVIQEGWPRCLLGPAPRDPADNGGPAEDEGLLVAPVLLDQQVAAVVEVALGPAREPRALPALLQFLVRLADLAGVYLLRHREQEQGGQQRRWAELEAFTQRIHTSLRPTEVAYRVANEGRQLVAADRLSVVLRWGRRAVVEAISGVEVVEPRSNLVRRLRRLSDRVLDWGEKLVYQGAPDDTLPPAVVRDLDGYLEESPSKLLVVLPLRDERDQREGQPPRKPRAALVLECFEPEVPVEQLVARLEVVARHATSALHNAALYRHVPLRFLWQPLAWVQAGLGGKERAIVFSVAAAVLTLIAALVFVPYPLKLDAKGQLLPVQRRWVYAPVEGKVVRFAEGIEPGTEVAEGQSLALLYDTQLETRVVQLTQEVAAVAHDIEALNKQMQADRTPEGRMRTQADRQQKEEQRKLKVSQLKALYERTHAEPSLPGHFWLQAPLRGTVLSWDFRQNLTNRLVRPSEPLLRVGDKTGPWEVELRVPQKHMGQVVRAFAALPAGRDLDVDLLVLSAPTRTFRGKLSRDSLAAEALPDREDLTTAEPVVFARVRLDGPDIPAAERVPPQLLLTGTEVHSKVRCGNHALGYSLFYGVWEFFYERVVFFF
jgi:hypothetical protein